MRKILLTSAGFENTNIQKIFLELVGKKQEIIKALFIPTAAINAAAIAVLPKCMNDLLNAGILEENIEVFDLHCEFTYDDLCKYDVIYFCGGNTKYLLNRINDTHFYKPLKKFIDNGGIYVGVSAGSCIAAKNIPNNLGLINCILSVHVQEGSKMGEIDISECPHIYLTNNQAILIQDDRYIIVE